MLIFIFNAINAQKFALVKCISGDCNNGKGIAEFTAPSNDEISGSVIYNGTFKEGKISGEGTISNKNHYYSGNFEDNYYRGYGTIFDTKKTGDVNIPDSIGYVTLWNWDDDGCHVGVTVQRDNARVAQHLGNYKKHRRFLDSDPWKDEWIMQHSNAVLAVSGRPPVYEVNTITEKTFYAQKGSWGQLIKWDCIAGRQYFVTASGWVKKRYTPLPFAGFVNYQVLDEKGTVVFDGPVDRYWIPEKDGNYSFMVKFDQGQMYGNGNELVDGTNLICSLRARIQL